MNSQTIKIPTWFFFVSAIALLWNLLGLFAFYADITRTEETIAAMDAVDREFFSSFPLWTKVVYGVATFGGFLGSLGLLLRKKWAQPLFVISLIAVIVQMAHSLFIAKGIELKGIGIAVFPVILILISAFLVWFSSFSAKKAWLS